MGRCDRQVKAYRAMAGGLKLRPRLVPEPLWWVSLANLADMDPRVLELWLDEGESPPDVQALWRSLERSTECEICGSRAQELDEVWEYEELDGGAVARLVGFRSLCSKCHLATHLGLAQIRRRFEEAFFWIRAVNGLSRTEAARLVDLAAEVWGCLNSIPRSRWSVELPALGESEVRPRLERLMTSMVRSERFRPARGWVWTPENPKVWAPNVQSALSEYPGPLSIVNEAREAGLKVLRQELSHAVSLLRRPSKLDGTPTVVGKWIVFMSTREALKLFRRVAEAIGSGSVPALRAKLSWKREDSKAVMVYTPNFLDPRGVAEVARWLASLGVAGRMVYKPDVFTLAGIYRSHPSLRPHIYEFEPAKVNVEGGALEAWL
ncbi:MAG: DUF1917 domain-containing protein [Candidatus Korarchaeota archaeon]|nr:DUF1917 domain-containing protein [Candidatus Korarchaeota archaeon]